MPRPNVLTYKGSGVLQILSDSEFNDVTEVVLEKFATVDGPGNIYSQQGANNAYVEIGTFTDTRFQGAIGSGDITILSTVYTLYQDVTNNWVSVANPPIHWDGTSIKESNDQDLNDIADEMINYMVFNEGPGSYQLAQSTPSGGTWTSIGSIDNINDTGLTTTYNLYKKIAGTTTLTYNLLKHVSGGTLRLMTTAELEQLVEKVRERIVTTGIGTYVFQETAPVTGTWVNKGSITDTRPTTQAQNYEGPSYTSDVPYQGESTVLYVGEGPVNYDTDYTGTYETAYEGSITANYDGLGPPLSYEGVVYDIDYDSASYTADYLGPDANYTAEAGSPGGGTEAYIADLEVNYVRDATFAGYDFDTYEGTFSQTYATDYVGPISYEGPGGPDVTYIREFYLGLTYFQLDYTSSGPDASYEGGNFYLGLTYFQLDYTGPGTLDFDFNYLGPGAPTNFQGSYLGPGTPDTITYQRDFSGVSLTYQGDYAGPGATPDYQGNYLGVSTYVGNYIGPAGPSITYVGDYGGPGIQYTADYLGRGPDITYVGDYTGSGAAINYTTSYNLDINYSGPSFVDLPYFIDYVGPGTSTNYSGPSFVDLPYFDDYVGPGAGLLYEAETAYEGPDSYEGVPYDGLIYVGPTTTYVSLVPEVSYTSLIPDNIAYTIDVPVDYVGAGLTYQTDYVASYTADYTASFTGPGPVTPYEGVELISYLTDYEGPSYTTSYLGTGPDAADYSGLVPTNYDGAVDYSSTYGGSIINNDSSTITTRTLWRRVA